MTAPWSWSQGICPTALSPGQLQPHYHDFLGQLPIQILLPRLLWTSSLLHPGARYSSRKLNSPLPRESTFALPLRYRRGQLRIDTIPEVTKAGPGPRKRRSDASLPLLSYLALSLFRPTISKARKVSFSLQFILRSSLSRSPGVLKVGARGPSSVLPDQNHSHNISMLFVFFSVSLF